MQQALLFLARALCVFFSTLFLLRLLMQWRRISFASPAGGFVLKLTNWAVLPMRRVIPGFWLDWASLIAAFVPHLFYALAFLFLSGLSAVLVTELDWALQLGIIALSSFLHTLIYLFIVLLLLRVILSWVNPYSPLAYPLAILTAPLLAPVQRFIPPISGIDLSPLVVILILQTLLFLV